MNIFQDATTSLIVWTVKKQVFFFWKTLASFPEHAPFHVNLLLLCCFIVGDSVIHQLLHLAVHVFIIQFMFVLTYLRKRAETSSSAWIFLNTDMCR